ncbi:flagellar motor switch/type III secretory pathway protein [Terriglobus roseus DSM 18391]|uniref:Flagellar motor switch/type III secretory pathway protein n=1 Tax=Terriglobus roseus (strain DSM 18391 / NRRL B-41598 / KBS 63) TaxID=926566 RepID=I3ZFW0_TERRK|nr:FliM/FliN family flagellar motor switch protein [Terriglobus roseus]AFL88128.1 flagellar motor switch/type III secretory pathway protein [Terriglobus roseus DSM 18391]
MSALETSLAVTDPVGITPTPSQDTMTRGAIRSIPFRLAVTIPVSGLKLRSLRELGIGELFVTDIAASEDVPVFLGGALLGYAELDNVDGAMAVRMTRLS